jgi:hypothetical protein
VVLFISPDKAMKSVEYSQPIAPVLARRAPVQIST